MTTHSGTYLVTETDEASAVLQDIDSGRVYTLTENPGLEPGDVAEATLRAVPPMEAVWEIEEATVREVEVVQLDDEPSEDARKAVAGLELGTLRRMEREWGELHAIAVPDATEAIDDVAADNSTAVRAARLGATRVEIRGAEGVVSVRYKKA
ncbi:MAG: DUF5812 family protein [Halobacteriaceae archaeon]